MSKLKNKKGVENAHRKAQATVQDLKEKESYSSRQVSAHDEETRTDSLHSCGKTDDDTDRLYCLFSVGFLSRILRPFLIFWAFSHFLEKFFGTAGRNIAYVLVIFIFAFMLIAGSLIVDKTLEKSSDVLPDWAVRSLKSRISEEALEMLDIKERNSEQK